MGFKANPLPGALGSIPIQPNQSSGAELAVGDQPKPLLCEKELGTCEEEFRTCPLPRCPALLGTEEAQSRFPGLESEQ